MSTIPESVPLPRAAPRKTDHGPPAGTARYSVPQTARALGISERAVRKRITAGTLDAFKDGTAWVVLLPTEPGTVLDAEPAAPSGSGAAPAEPDTVLGGGTSTALDLQPLADLIGDLTRQLADASGAAGAWQARALQAEQRLKQLKAGTISEPAAVEPETAHGDAPGRAEPATMGKDTGATGTAAPRTWVQRLAAMFRGNG